MGNTARRMGLINCPGDSAHSRHCQFARKKFRESLQKHGPAKAILLAKVFQIREPAVPPRYFHFSSGVLLLTPGNPCVEGRVIASVIFIVRRISTITIFPGASQCEAVARN
jgi:hypothetical protein